MKPIRTTINETFSKIYSIFLIIKLKKRINPASQRLLSVILKDPQQYNVQSWTKKKVNTTY